MRIERVWSRNDGNQWRAIVLYEGDGLDETGLRAAIQWAVRFNVARTK